MDYDGDPFDGANEDEDEFGTSADTPRQDFIGLDRLDGRLCVFDVTKIGTKTGNSGKPYTYAECNVIVLDGDPIEPQLPTIPGVVPAMHVSGVNVVDVLETWFKNSAGKPFLARLDSVPSKQNKQIKVMGVRKHEITDADKAAARGPWRKYKSEVPF